MGLETWVGYLRAAEPAARAPLEAEEPIAVPIGTLRFTVYVDVISYLVHGPSSEV